MYPSGTSSHKPNGVTGVMVSSHCVGVWTVSSAGAAVSSAGAGSYFVERVFAGIAVTGALISKYTPRVDAIGLCSDSLKSGNSGSSSSDSGDVGMFVGFTSLSANKATNLHDMSARLLLCPGMSSDVVGQCFVNATSSDHPTERWYFAVRYSHFALGVVRPIRIVSADLLSPTYKSFGIAGSL